MVEILITHFLRNSASCRLHTYRAWNHMPERFGKCKRLKEKETLDRDFGTNFSNFLPGIMTVLKLYGNKGSSSQKYNWTSICFWRVQPRKSKSNICQQAPGALIWKGHVTCPGVTRGRRSTGHLWKFKSRGTHKDTHMWYHSQVRLLSPTG